MENFINKTGAVSPAAGAVKSLKQKMRAAENICGTHVSMHTPLVTELLGYADFDFIWVDTEHAPIGYENLLGHIGSGRLTGTPVIVRVSANDFNHVKRVLEMGPDGIVFPMISTAVQAAEAMEFTLYPPYGKRGFGPLGAIRYGTENTAEYVKNSRDNICRVVQIETEEAVANLPEIIKNPYIDAFVFGPRDLAASVGELEYELGEKTLALIKKATGILRGAGKCAGISTGSDDPAMVKFWHGLGINMISSGVDYDYIIRGARANSERIRKIFAENNLKGEGN